MSYKLNGVIFVYNPEDKRHAEELNLWYEQITRATRTTSSLSLSLD